MQNPETPLPDSPLSSPETSDDEGGDEGGDDDEGDDDRQEQQHRRGRRREVDASFLELPPSLGLVPSGGPDYGSGVAVAVAGSPPSAIAAAMASPAAEPTPFDEPNRGARPSHRWRGGAAGFRIDRNSGRRLTAGAADGTMGGEGLVTGVAAAVTPGPFDLDDRRGRVGKDPGAGGDDGDGDDEKRANAHAHVYGDGGSDVPDDEKKLDDGAVYRSSFDLVGEEEAAEEEDEEEDDELMMGSGAISPQRSTSFDLRFLPSKAAPGPAASSFLAERLGDHGEEEDDWNEPPSLATKPHQQSGKSHGPAPSRSRPRTSEGATPSPAPSSSEVPPSLSLVEEAKRRFLARPRMLEGRSKTTGGVLETSRAGDGRRFLAGDTVAATAAAAGDDGGDELLGRYPGPSQRSRAAVTPPLSRAGRDPSGGGAGGPGPTGNDDGGGRGQPGLLRHARGASHGDVAGLRAFYMQQHHKGGTTASATNLGAARAVVGVDQEQHLRFAALKRDIVAAAAAASTNGRWTKTTTSAAAGRFQSSAIARWGDEAPSEGRAEPRQDWPPEPLAAAPPPQTEAGEEKTDVPLRGDWRTRRASPTAWSVLPPSADDSQFPGFYGGTQYSRSDPPPPPPDAAVEASADAVVATAEDGTSLSHAWSSSEGPLATVSPEGGTEVMEMSVMVSPDGEIDYSKPVINLVPSPSREMNVAYETRIEAALEPATADNLEEGALHGVEEDVDPLALPNLNILHHPDIVPRVDEGDARSSLNGSDAKLSAGRTPCSPLTGVDKETRRELPPLGPVKSYSSGSGGRAGDATPTSRSVASYTPPDRAWVDYLIFRGVSVNTSPSGRSDTLESVGTATAGQSPISGLMISTDVSPAQQNAWDGAIDTAPPPPVGGPEKASGLEKPHQTTYRELTPKKDLLVSDKSAGWLQEELRRRAFVKHEINHAILAIGRETGSQSEPPRSESVTNSERSSKFFGSDIEDCNSTSDEEVAAINAEGGSREMDMVDDPYEDQSQGGRAPGNHSMEGPTPHMHDFDGRQEPNPFKGTDVTGDPVVAENVRPPEFVDMQDEMRKFASETRAALRDQSYTEVTAEGTVTKFTPVEVPSPLSVNLAMGSGEEARNIPLKTTRATKESKDSKTTISGSTGAEFADLQSNEAPVMLRSMDCFEGIAKGDITLSLLSENTGTIATSIAATWANRVHGAVWRSRRMRRNMMHMIEIHPHQPPGSPARGRSSLPVDMDQARVAGGIRTVESTQAAALLHLKHDELDETIELYEDIIFAYYSYFERSLNLREKNMTVKSDVGSIDFKPYLGMALHNLGILNLLKGDYDEALSFFIRSVENRKSHLGEGHRDHIVSQKGWGITRSLPVDETLTHYFSLFRSRRW